MTLSNANIETQYTIQSVDTKDKELDAFLFSLGCYAGEKVSIISRKRSSCVVALKDSRYCIDKRLAAAIYVETENEQ